MQTGKALRFTKSEGWVPVLSSYSFCRAARRCENRRALVILLVVFVFRFFDEAQAVKCVCAIPGPAFTFFAGFYAQAQIVWGGRG